MSLLIENVLSAATTLSELGMVFGRGGNISVHQGREFAITRSGSDLSRLDERDVTLCPTGFSEFQVPQISCEWRMHDAIYQAREDARIVVHAHLRRPVVLHAMNEEIRFFTLDHVVSVGQVAYCGYAPSGSLELTQAVGGVISGHSAVVLGFHGVVVVGSTVREAIERLFFLDDAAQSTIDALAAGDRLSGIPAELASSITAV